MVTQNSTPDFNSDIKLDDESAEKVRVFLEAFNSTAAGLHNMMDVPQEAASSKSAGQTHDSDESFEVGEAYTSTGARIQKTTGDSQEAVLSKLAGSAHDSDDSFDYEIDPDSKAHHDSTLSSKSEGKANDSDEAFDCEIDPDSKAPHDSTLSSKSCENVDPVREASLRLLKWLLHEYLSNPTKADELLQEALSLYKESNDLNPAGQWLLQHFQRLLQLEHSGLTCSLDELPTPCPSGFAVFSTEQLYQTVSKAIEPWHVAIGQRLLPTWQTRVLTITGKWDVKNLKKWADVEPVSQPIGGQFYALKTLRDVDPLHTPRVFAQKWSDKIFAIIDVSLDRPVYTPLDVKEAGIEYRKLPMVSKEYPPPEDVNDFVRVVDELKAMMEPDDKRLIGVHCHYGFNRTGFLLVSYLALKGVMPVEDGIAEFALKRKPKGIRHQWFLDELIKRYGDL